MGQLFVCSLPGVWQIVVGIFAQLSALRNLFAFESVCPVRLSQRASPFARWVPVHDHLVRNHLAPSLLVRLFAIRWTVRHRWGIFATACSCDRALPPYHNSDIGPPMIVLGVVVR